MKYIISFLITGSMLILVLPGCTNDKDIQNNGSVDMCRALAANDTTPCGSDCTHCSDVLSTVHDSESGVIDSAEDTSGDTASDTIGNDSAALDSETVTVQDTADDSDSIGDTATEPTPLYVDVRTPGEYDEGHYPDAVNIPLDTLLDNLDALLPKDRWLIVYCASGYRAGQAQSLLESEGFTQIENGGDLNSLLP